MENERIIENMIHWAKDKMGCGDYTGWCLDFIEDALEVGNDIEIFGGDCARESFEMYQDSVRTGIPERGNGVKTPVLAAETGGRLKSLRMAKSEREAGRLFL